MILLHTIHVLHSYVAALLADYGAAACARPHVRPSTDAVFTLVMASAVKSVIADNAGARFAAFRPYGAAHRAVICGLGDKSAIGRTADIHAAGISRLAGRFFGTDNAIRNGINGPHGAMHCRDEDHHQKSKP